MQRPTRIALGLALASTAAVVGLATPASASGTVFYHSYGYDEACNYVSQEGLLNHTWVASYCNEVTPSGHTNYGSPFPGQYDLYVQYS
jgi:hypothetical protein